MEITCKSANKCKNIGKIETCTYSDGSRCSSFEEKEESIKTCPFCGEIPTIGENLFGKTVYCWNKDEDCGHRGIIMSLKQWQRRANDK